MTSVEFYKVQATGNDFVAIDGRNLSFPENNKELVQGLCHRRFGVGADGLLLVGNPRYQNCDFEMVYRNSDGSYAEMCGNGARAIVRFFHQCLASEKKSTYHFHVDDNLYQADIEGDLISLEMSQIKDAEKFDLTQFPLGERSYFVDTGVPHCVFFHDDIEDFEKWASEIRNSSIFTEGSNVNLVQVKEGQDKISIRTFERGVEGETWSCGTGVTACAIAFRERINKTSEVQVQTLGGNLVVVFDEAKIYLKGPAELVFQGKVDLRL